MWLNDLFRTNIARALKWHPGGIEEWSPLEWAGAMAGEAGEAANAAKKLKRVESKLQNINAPGRSLIDVESARVAVSEEVADTILYGLLLMARVGITDPESVIAKVFNRKSEEYGFPERVTVPTAAYEFLSPKFIEAMNDIGRYGHEKYGKDSFHHRALTGDTSRGSLSRTKPYAIAQHAADHFASHLLGIPHDHFNTKRHQLAAVAFNAMMEFYFAGLEHEQ